MEMSPKESGVRMEDSISWGIQILGESSRDGKQGEQREPGEVKWKSKRVYMPNATGVNRKGEVTGFCQLGYLKMTFLGKSNFSIVVGTECSARFEVTIRTFISKCLNTVKVVCVKLYMGCLISFGALNFYMAELLKSFIFPRYFVCFFGSCH